MIENTHFLILNLENLLDAEKAFFIKKFATMPAWRVPLILSVLSDANYSVRAVSNLLDILKHDDPISGFLIQSRNTQDFIMKMNTVFDI